MPKLSILEGCIAADRSGIRKKLERVDARKKETRQDHLEALFRVRNYVDQNYARPILLTELAKVARMTSFNLVRSFGQVYGQTPLQYVTERRLAAAHLMLERDSTSVLEVALAVGWSSVTSFSRAFKKKFRVPPISVKKSNLR